MFILYALWALRMQRLKDDHVSCVYGHLSYMFMYTRTNTQTH